VNKSSTSDVSQANAERLEVRRDDDIDRSVSPEVTEGQMARAVMRISGVPVERGKRRVTMFLDAAIVDYFKAKAGERGYQTLINEVLAGYICGHDLVATLRRIIREELERPPRPT
jgi:uncharacterized protein (DUF4415 family)